MFLLSYHLLDAPAFKPLSVIKTFLLKPSIIGPKPIMFRPYGSIMFVQNIIDYVFGESIMFGV